VIADVPAEQVCGILERVAEEIVAEVRVAAPPVNAIAVAKSLGLSVVRAEFPERARFARLAGGGRLLPTIMLADDPRPERRQWAVAHEIGEYAAHRVVAELGIDPVDAGEAAREEIANRLAGRLWLPRAWFLADGIDLNWDLFELKARYATASCELIARRMLEMPPAVVVTVFDQGRLTWRRSNRAGRTPGHSAAERDARQAAHDVGAPTRCDEHELPEGVADVRAWPVHEEGWKREIVRTELAEIEAW
jgi:hypothetical protein